MNVTVYLGASPGNNPAFEEAARETGELIARKGHTLVYGGCGTGLMGVLASTVVESGGRAIGVIPDFLTRIEPPQEGLSELLMVRSMEERKAKMIELGDAFVALPGGPGTLEEISEVYSLMKLHDVGAQPDVASGGCVFFSKAGFYDPLREQMAAMHLAGFLSESLYSRLSFPETVEELAACLR